MPRPWMLTAVFLHSLPLVPCSHSTLAFLVNTLLFFSSNIPPRRVLSSFLLRQTLAKRLDGRKSFARVEPSQVCFTYIHRTSRTEQVCCTRFLSNSLVNSNPLTYFLNIDRVYLLYFIRGTFKISQDIFHFSIRNRYVFFLL